MSRWGILPHLAGVGAVTLLGQVVLLRELDVAFYGSELIYVLGIGFWMLCTGLGAALPRRRERQGESAASAPRLLFALFALLLAAAVVTSRDLRPLFGGLPGAFLPFEQQLLGLALVLLPTSLIGGALFQRTARAWIGRGGTLAGAYAVESAGGLIGGVLATSFSRLGLQNLAAGLAAASVATILALPSRPSRQRWTVGLWFLLAAGLGLGWSWQDRIDLAMTSWTHENLAASQDTPYGRVTLEGAGGQMALFDQDRLSFDTEQTAAEELAHLAALEHPHPRRIALVGGVGSGLIAELLRHDPGRIDALVLDRQRLKLIEQNLPPELEESLHDPRVRLILGDPRAGLEKLQQVDVLVLAMPEPSSARTNRYYTEQFFALCKRALAPGGVLALRLPGAENIWTPQLLLRTASIQRAIETSFPHLLVVPGTNFTFLAAEHPLERDPRVLGGRLEARGIHPRLLIPPYIDYLLTNDRLPELAKALAETAAPVNSDARPVCYRFELTIWLSRFFPQLAWSRTAPGSPGQWVRRPALWAAAVALLLGLLLLRRWDALRRSLLAGLAGFGGILLESVLLVHYQTSRGVLYQDLGLLLTAFMAGLAAGAAAGARWPGRARSLTLAAIAAGTLVTALLALLLARGAALNLLECSLFLFGAGTITAALFAAASRRERRPESLVAPLYAADLAGGALGSALASVWLLPLAGLTLTALLTILVLLLGSLLA